MNLNFFVGDDYPTVRTGMKVLLKKVYGPVRIAESQLDLELMKSHLQNCGKTDLLIFGISKSNAEALSQVIHIHKAVPELRILVLDKADNPTFAELFLRNGISGYIAKSSDEAELVKAVEMILAGNNYLSLPMLEIFSSTNYTPNLFSTLSTSELLVVQFLVEGYDHERIANFLNLNFQTIKVYRHRIYRKLNLKNMLQLVQLAKHHKLI